jgi:hypothetical protein
MTNASHSPDSRLGAVPVAGPPKRRRWLLPALLALLALIAVLALLSRCGDDDAATTGTPSSPTATPATTATATSAPASTAASPDGAGTTGAGQAGEPGTVTAGGADLLEYPTTETLNAHDGQETVARGVRVQSVPADEGFWVGADDQNRLWVQLTGTGGESDYKVKEGDTVDFTGSVTRSAPGFAAEQGVTQAEGADQLTEQGHYLSTPASGVKLSS